MNIPQSSQQTAEMDARNRAAAYTREANYEATQREQAIAQQRTSDLQQMLWFKSLDQTHARDLQAQLQAHEMALRNADYRAAVELEMRKGQNALELRRLELQRGGLKGDTKAQEQSHTTFWHSKIFETILLVLYR